MKKVGIAKWMACLLAVVLVAAMVPNRVMAADKTMTLSSSSPLWNRGTVHSMDRVLWYNGPRMKKPT